MSEEFERNDIDPGETREWIEAFEMVLEEEGAERAGFLIDRLLESAHRRGDAVLPRRTTPYLNTIPPHREERHPGDLELEARLEALIRWNAMAMVVRANRTGLELGGHISTYASAATLYEVGLNHFFHAPSADHGGDLVLVQGHSSPGIYARAFLEGRLSEEQIDHFRQEVDGRGVSSYPHPWLMPDFWQFAVVSMGLGPIMAIYQARFMKYLEARGLADTEGRKVWVFLGDGEMDEPESIGAIPVAARERLDNLIFVVNCNLQRLDGPVRGNGKIIQELEAIFQGAGWNVIKVIWGSDWDPLLAADRTGALVRRMEAALDGDYQAYAAHGGAYIREHFFGKDEALAKLVEDLSDDDLRRLHRGGHDRQKVYAAYAAAMRADRPTIILAKTVKGYGLGRAGEGLNPTHQQKKMKEEDLTVFRDRFNLDIPDDKIDEFPFLKPPGNSREIGYLKERREALGGSLPVRKVDAELLEVPGLDAFKTITDGSGDREISTTMAFVRILAALVRDKEVGKRIVPIVADEARTFGMEGLFRQLGIYSPVGQLYTPVDADQLAPYKESEDGQMLQEGITEAGALCSWLAAGTSYATHGLHTIPFFIFYSMFGFQRVGDLIWAASDMQAKGFLIGATSGRTTLNGEGLQHQDGHSHLQASTVPTCRAYDPTFGYELAVIVQDGLKRMFQDGERVFYYITALNENYRHPPLPKGAEEGILRGLYLLGESGGSAKKKGGKKGSSPRVQLLGSGSILQEVIAGGDLLEEQFGVAADIWAVPSFTELRRDGISVERWNRLHPKAKPRKSHVEKSLAGRQGPAVAATDYVRSFSEQIRPWVGRPYTTLGTDGFGRSDSREKLRHFFEVDRRHVAYAALRSLAEEGEIPGSRLEAAIKKLDIDPAKADPWTE